MKYIPYYSFSPDSILIGAIEPKIDIGARIKILLF